MFGQNLRDRVKVCSQGAGGVIDLENRSYYAYPRFSSGKLIFGEGATVSGVVL